VHCSPSPRRPDAQKGDFGLALIVGGSRGMAGAVAMAGMAALRSGRRIGAAGRAGSHPGHGRRLRAVVHDHPLRSDPAGLIAAGTLDRITELAEKAHYQMQHSLPSAFDSIASWAAKVHGHRLWSRAGPLAESR